MILFITTAVRTSDPTILLRFNAPRENAITQIVTEEEEDGDEKEENKVGTITVTVEWVTLVLLHIREGPDKTGYPH
jgi:hypothetical protein